MQKIIYPAKVPEGEGMEKMFIKITLEAGKLSMSGVIGPRPNGNSAGGCGQIDMEFQHRESSRDDSRYTAPTRPEDMEFMPGWDREKWFDFLDVWSKWHLNDMRASCEHQEAEGWEDMAREKVVFYNWVLNDETSQKQSALKEEAITRASSIDPGHSVGFFAEEKRIMRLPYSLKTETPDLKGFDLKYYKPARDHQEEKARGWLDQAESPRGLLGKACAVCSYEYGSAWKKRDLPEAVIKFISKLPEASEKPAWV